MNSNVKDQSIPGGVPVMPGRILDSATIFAGLREIGILHAGALYRLQMTRQGKLILTK